MDREDMCLAYRESVVDPVIDPGNVSPYIALISRLFYIQFLTYILIFSEMHLPLGGWNSALPGQSQKKGVLKDKLRWGGSGGPVRLLHSLAAGIITAYSLKSWPLPLCALFVEVSRQLQLNRTAPPPSNKTKTLTSMGVGLGFKIIKPLNGFLYCFRTQTPPPNEKERFTSRLIGYSIWCATLEQHYFWCLANSRFK